MALTTFSARDLFGVFVRVVCLCCCGFTAHGNRTGNGFDGCMRSHVIHVGGCAVNSLMVSMAFWAALRWLMMGHLESSNNSGHAISSGSLFRRFVWLIWLIWLIWVDGLMGGLSADERGFPRRRAGFPRSGLGRRAAGPHTTPRRGCRRGTDLEEYAPCGRATITPREAQQTRLATARETSHVSHTGLLA